jgi:glycosyltransferase involved in cell wall biosynthesis
MIQDQVTVIIPTFNSARYLIDAVESALAQTAPPAQIIVVDDGSTDDTAARLQPYESRLTIIRQRNQGTAAARNAGSRIAVGNFIAFLDADDVWHPRKLELQLRAFRDHPNVALLGTQSVDYPHQPFHPIQSRGHIEQITLKRLLVRNYFAASSVMIRRAAVEQVGDFDRTLSGVEDLDYWQRTAASRPVANLALPLTGYRRVPGSIGSRAVGIENGLRRVLQKLDSRAAWQGQPFLRRKAISQMHFSLAYLHGAAGHQWAALRRMLQSFIWYPFPYARRESGTTFARLRRTAALLFRLLRLMPPEPAPFDGAAANDA